MSDNRLQEIQSLQFVDKVRAEALLKTFISEIFPLHIVEVELRPLATSLNSFNGFLKLADGRQLFFKTHTEPDSVIQEYYNSTMLAGAGYPVIQPILRSNEWGKQLLIYEVVEDPPVFDVAWTIENGATEDFAALQKAQNKADENLFELYMAALNQQTSEEAAKAGIHQLFYHRLTGGRLERFYGPLPGKSGQEVSLTLPIGTTSMREVRRRKWIINGQHYTVTLDDLIDQAIALLNPAQSGPSIIGHGDAHNGNVFFRKASNELVYFDPAFAGRHHPLLDLTKPLFHNVFAMWMYFPQEKARDLHITIHADNQTWQVQHDYSLPPVRKMFLTSKVDHVLLPVLRELKSRSWLQDNWRRYLKAALFCCPFLTMNLSDQTRFPPEISLLGLTMAIEMGAESHHHRSYIDQVLDSIDSQL